MRYIKNVSGFTLPEILVAVAMMSVTVGGVMMIVSDNTTKNTFKGSVLGTSACLTEAQRVISSLKDRGAVRARVNISQAQVANNYPDSANNALIPYAPAAMSTKISPTYSIPEANESGLTVAERWPNTTLPVLDFTADTTDFSAPVARPHMLVMGYMNTLRSIYMYDKTGFCSGARGQNFYSSAGGATNHFNTIFQDPQNLSMENVKEYVKIEPFDTQTGTTVAGCPDVEPRAPRANEGTLDAELLQPPGINSNNVPLAASNVRVITKAPGAAGNRGFLVTATVTFKDRVGRDRECSASERFQYNMQPNTSLSLDVTDAPDTIASVDDTTTAAEELSGLIRSSTLANPPSYTNTATTHFLACDDSTPLNDTIRIRIGNVNEGSIMMCRNLSVVRTIGPTDAAGGKYITFAEKRRQTFYSTELSRTDYFKANTTSESLIAGMYYGDGTYYCTTSRNCPGLSYWPATVNTGTTGFTNLTDAPVGNVKYPFPQTGQATFMQDASKKWQPCERISICPRTTAPVTAAINPSVARFVPGDSAVGRSNAYHMKFVNVPQGCDIHIQIAEVDAGYNIRTTEYRGYVQEKAPGKYVCRTATTSAEPNVPGNTWFYACPATATPPYGTDCSAAPAGTACCMTFPNYPSTYRPYYTP